MRITGYLVGLGAMSLVNCSGDPEVSGTAAGSSGNGAGGADATAGTDGGGGKLSLGGSTGSQAGGGGKAPTDDTSGCGDAILQKVSLGEACDDGNSASGDGCSADCKAVEANFACLAPGEACESTVECGDGKVTGAETCDDGNALALDGCDTACALEPGWVCPTPDDACQAASCGDGIVAGVEQCEDDDGASPAGSDGCSPTCALEPGYVCETVGQACRKAICGDGIVEGGEPCDDDNDIIGDGCSPSCEAEPICQRPTDPDGCSSSCGDGLILSGDDEACDDGNKRDGDGCSADCQVEPGYLCVQQAGQLPATLTIPFVFRDFIALPSATTQKQRHPDFQARCSSVSTGMVADTLDAQGKPDNSGACNYAAECTLDLGPEVYGGDLCEANESCPNGFDGCDELHGLHRLTGHPDTDPFDFWYRDTAGVNLSKVVPTTLTLAAGKYSFESTALYPFDNDGWVAAGDEDSHNGAHNYGFTSEVRRWFEFNGGELLTFSGDDDVWVFINGKLALDIGGVHGVEVRSIRLNANGSVDCKNGDGTFDSLGDCSVPTRNLGLQVGKVYEITLFHAERHTTESNFRLALTGFVDVKSKCSPVCGDGTQTPGEQCDSGQANDDAAYGGCTKKCKRGPRCGDGVEQAAHEACDDGSNVTPYSADGTGCAPGCQPPAYCGDSNVDSIFGEQCDDGTNDGGYGGCEADCSFGPRCGDDVIDEPRENCDDGNAVSGDGCSSICVLEMPK